MFVGKFTPSLDSKSRLFIPAKYRLELGNQFVITKSTDGCLRVYPMSFWNEYTARIEALPMTQSAQIRRFIFSDACDVEPDSQGRIVLSQELRDYASIEKDTVVVGVNSYLEIWSSEKWKENMEQQSAEDIQKLMIELGF